MRNLFDQTEHVKALELSRHRRWGDIQVRQQISATPAVDSELAELQGAQQGLLDGVEEVQALDTGIGTDAGLTQALQITLAGAGVVQAGQEFEIALIAAEQGLAQFDQAVDGVLQRRDLARAGARCGVPPCGVVDERDIVGGGLDAAWRFRCRWSSSGLNVLS